MKVLAASDIHGDKKLVGKLARRAENEEADLIVLCGDITQFEKDLEGLIGSFKRENKEVLIISGNHESIDTVEELVDQYKPGVNSLHGTPFEVEEEDAGFFGIGSSTVFDPLEASKSLTYSFKEIEDKKRKIMVVHQPPAGTEVDELRGRHVGSKLIREAVEELQPDFCLCGHIHENFGKEDKIGDTKVINVGRKGRILEI